MLDLAQSGDGPTAWRVHLGLFASSYHTLLEDSEKFRCTVMKADDLHQLFWERQGKRMVQGGNGNGNVYGLIMANKFGWSSSKNESKVVADITADATDKSRPLTEEELIKELEARGLPTSLLIEASDED